MADGQESTGSTLEKSALEDPRTNEDEATVSDNEECVQEEHEEQPSEELKKTVEAVLSKGIKQGFLERKGSRFLYGVTDMMRKKLVIQYLQKERNGATVGDILDYMEEEYYERPSVALKNTVMAVLKNGTKQGFLERKGSKFLYWVAKGASRRRRSRSRRLIRHRSSRRRLQRRYRS